MNLTFLERAYSKLMTTMAVGLLALYLTCTLYGVIELSVYENISGLGLMALGVLLYFGGELALTESWVVRSPTRVQVRKSPTSSTGRLQDRTFLDVPRLLLSITAPGAASRFRPCPVSALRRVTLKYVISGERSDDTPERLCEFQTPSTPLRIHPPREFGYPSGGVEVSSLQPDSLEFDTNYVAPKAATP